MGREIKRVPVDFDWPLEQIWAGYVNPYSSVKCQTCDGRGISKEYQRLSDEWHGLKDGRYEFEATMNQLTQEEVNLLVDNERLINIAYDRIDGKFVQRRNEDGSLYYPTAELVNEQSLIRVMFHNSINEYIVVSHRAEKLGIESECSACGGSGEFWASEEIKKAHEEWEDIRPPEGEGWQVWETVSEGSPITPVFATAEELIDYLCEYGDLWCQKRPNESPPSRKAAENFVLGCQWVPSETCVDDGVIRTGIQSAEVMGDK